MSFVGSNILAGASGQGGAGGYEIERSLRFNSGDSAYLNRTPSAAGNRKTWTWSGWVKRSNTGVKHHIFAVHGSNNDSGYFRLAFQTDGTLFVGLWSKSILTTVATFRDFSAWYHVVLVLDNTNSTEADRIILYVNGVRQSVTGTADSNTDYAINSTQAHNIGWQTATSQYFDGYLADLHFIDGQALAPTDFGKTDDNGVWQPKKFEGDYVTSYSGTTTSLSQTGWNPSQSGNIWDGNASSASRATGYAGGTKGTVSFTPPLTNITKVEIWTQNYVNYLNGVSVSTPENTNGGWHTLYDNSGSPITLNSVGNAYDSNNTQSVDIAGVRINGSIVNSQTWTPPSGVGFVSISNSFHLDFADNSSNAALGTDTSGNNNTWTVTNLSVAAGAGNDSLRDSPTNGTQADTGLGGELSGNYATLNPLQNISGDTFSDGNLKVQTSTSNYGVHTSTIATPLTGKWYAEVLIASYSGYDEVSIVPSDSTFTTSTHGPNIPDSVCYRWNGDIKKNNVTVATGTALNNGNTVGIAYDADNSTLVFYRNSVAQPTVTGVAAKQFFFAASDYHGSGSGLYVWNFGQRAFSNTNLPSGYKCLCTANLPEPTIADGSKYFDTKLYSGTSSSQALTMANSELSPDFVWIKSRNSTYDNALTDSVRGAGKVLFSSGTYAETTYATSLTSFDSNGFTLGSDAFVNGSSNQFAAWVWDAGTSTVSNTDGSITSQVRASATSGFSIVGYNGDNNAGDTVGHGLNAAPEVIFIKGRENTFTWYVYHSSIGATKYLRLDTDNMESTGSGAFNNTAPTSSVFSLGQDNAVNDGNKDYIAYCFAPVEGYSSFGKFTANASTDGPFVYLGFRPALVVCKKSSNSSIWIALDSERDPNNVTTNFLRWNDTDAEASTADRMDFLSNGFKLRAPGGYSPNETNGDTYIYLAFAEHPFKTARAR